MTEIGPRLRALIIHARKDPAQWGKSKGLSQAELAAKAGTSQVWLRQIETGYTETAKADTLGNICDVLRIDPELLRKLGYADVADSMEASVMLRGGEVDLTHHDNQAVAERHLRNTPGLSFDQKELLVEALGVIRKEEPLGQELWRRRKKKEEA